MPLTIVEFHVFAFGFLVIVLEAECLVALRTLFDFFCWLLLWSRPVCRVCFILVVFNAA